MNPRKAFSILGSVPHRVVAGNVHPGECQRESQRFLTGDFHCKVKETKLGVWCTCDYNRKQERVLQLTRQTCPNSATALMAGVGRPILQHSTST